MAASPGTVRNSIVRPTKCTQNKRHAHNVKARLAAIKAACLPLDPDLTCIKVRTLFLTSVSQWK